MGIILQKFGGTSVGSTEKIKQAAKKIIATVEAGHEVVAVVSAMGKQTDELVALAAGITERPSKREMDVLLTTGEQVTISLLAMALQEEGYEAQSFTGWQAGIETEPVHGNARIAAIDPQQLQNSLQAGKIPIVAGFQGVTTEQHITTLGRGGSDTTAVALAAVLRADVCEIYTDVSGVYTADPRVIPTAQKLKRISYDEMLELANLGAGVLHPRAVEFAKNYGITLEVRNSASDERGTIVEEDVQMENGTIVRGLAFEGNVTKLTLRQLPSREDTLANVFTLLAQHGINVDIIIQSVNEEKTDLSFSIDSTLLTETVSLLTSHQASLGYEKLIEQGELAKVSIVGSGMISNHGVAATMFRALAEKNVFIKMVSTSEIKVSAVVPQADMVKAIETLHDVFQLDAREVVPS
ncbi:aspartate kinase [Fictibacillus macauensis ZFHKF-1]|uniref:Aspartokinase n=1 Tax=Fictibacillus macauensis ZFHKF-1 TaxID=1196324 RepID=I8UES4_9BACL|nr:aspartate kinase [Fictibacillus macauensis]EIT85405.1 aspartate kinase [Fictibacillus macauensis ZFHKF-1]